MAWHGSPTAHTTVRVSGGATQWRRKWCCARLRSPARSHPPPPGRGGGNLSLGLVHQHEVVRVLRSQSQSVMQAVVHLVLLVKHPPVVRGAPQEGFHRGQRTCVRVSRRPAGLGAWVAGSLVGQERQAVLAPPVQSGAHAQPVVQGPFVSAVHESTPRLVRLVRIHEAPEAGVAQGQPERVHGVHIHGGVVQSAPQLGGHAGVEGEQEDARGRLPGAHRVHRVHQGAGLPGPGHGVEQDVLSPLGGFHGRHDGAYGLRLLQAHHICSCIPTVH